MPAICARVLPQRRCELEGPDACHRLTLRWTADRTERSPSADWLRRLAWPGRNHVVGHLRRRRVGGEPVVNPLPELVRQVLAELEHRLDRGDHQRECHYPAGDVMEPRQ